MATAHVDEIARRVILVEDHIAFQPRTAVASLEQIVAEDGVMGEVPAPSIEGVDVINPLSDKRPFTEEILIEIGDNPRIRIDADGASVHPAEPRTLGAGEGGRYAGLEDGIAVADSAPGCVRNRFVENVGHRTDHLPRGIAWQLGIGIERDHIAHQRENFLATHHGGKPPPFPAQGCIEIGQFPALPFEPHPNALLRIPLPFSVQQHEDIVSAAGVGGVEPLDSVARQLHTLGILRHMFGGRVNQIGEQGKVQMIAPIGQIPALQPFEQQFDVLRTGEHGGHCHQRSVVRWNSLQQTQPRQRLRAHQNGGDPIHKTDADLPSTERQRHGYQAEHAPSHRICSD